MVMSRNLLVDQNMRIITSNLNGSKACLQNISYAKYNQDSEQHMTFVWDIMQCRLAVTDVSGPIGCRETSANDYHYILRNIPEE